MTGRRALDQLPRHVWGTLTVTIMLALLLLPGTPSQAADAAETELALRYAPRISLVLQEQECGPGEPYPPSAVGPLFDNPAVALRGPWTTRDLITVAPSEQDLARPLSGYSLDFPGAALAPGCTYEKWVKRDWEGVPPTIYAHVATEEGRANRLALQYYFFYPYNDYNNKHEGDWERVQLEFDVGTVAEALTREPVRTAYSQHYGVELAHWGGQKLEIRDGSHPVVYVSAGSHASQYSSGLAIGRNAEQGFGCDNTSGAQKVLEPAVVVLDSDLERARQEHPWLAFEGHWGELGPQVFYDAPTGPALTSTWGKPFTWSDAGRDGSFMIPGDAAVVAGPATSVFCGAIAGGSDLFRQFTNKPLPVLLAIGAVLVVAAFLVRATKWRNTSPLPALQGRGVGQIISDSAELLRAHWRLWIGIGSPGVLLAGLSLLGLALSESSGLLSGVASLATSLLIAVLTTLVTGATSQAVRLLDEQGRASVRESYRLVFARFWPTLVTLALFLVALVALTLSVYLSIVALVLTLGWSMWNVVVQVEERTGIDALRRSWRLARRQWLTVVAVVGLIALLAAFLGGVLATLALVAVQLPPVMFHLIPGLTSVLLQPFAALLLTYTYFNGRALEDEAIDGAAASQVGQGEPRGEQPAISR